MKMQTLCQHCGQPNELLITAAKPAPRPAPPPRAPSDLPASLPRMVRAWTRTMKQGHYNNHQLLEDYNTWAAGAGAVQVPDAHALSRILSDQGHDRWRRSTERGWTIYPPQRADIGTRAATSQETRRFDLEPGTKWQPSLGSWLVVPA